VIVALAAAPLLAVARPSAPAFAAVAAGAASGRAVDASGAADSKGDAKLVETLVPKARAILPSPLEIEDADRASIEAATGGTLGEIATFEGTALDGRTKKDVRILYALAWGESGKARVRVAVAQGEKGEVRAARAVAVEPAGSAEPAAFDPLFDVFVGSSGLRTNKESWKPITELEARRKAAEAGGGDEGKKLAFALRQVDTMRGIGEKTQTLPRLISAKATETEATARAVAEAFGEVASFAPELSVFLPKADVDAYASKALEARKVFESIASAAAAAKTDADWKAVLDLTGEKAQRACGQCHGWDSHAFRKPLQGAFRNQVRGSLGIGEGYFVVGHDVPAVPGVSSDEAQAAAHAVKKALLYLKVAEPTG
jgi:hypothetical protein